MKVRILTNLLESTSQSTESQSKVLGRVKTLYSYREWEGQLLKETAEGAYLAVGEQRKVFILAACIVEIVYMEDTNA